MIEWIRALQQGRPILQPAGGVQGGGAAYGGLPVSPLPASRCAASTGSELCSSADPKQLLLIGCDVLRPQAAAVLLLGAWLALVHSAGTLCCGHDSSHELLCTLPPSSHLLVPPVLLFCLSGMLLVAPLLMVCHASNLAVSIPMSTSQ